MSLINIINLTFGYEDSQHNLFENVNLQLDTNWKLGMIGRNGKGKTTLCKLLMHQYPYHGHIQAQVNFEYFPYQLADENMLTLDIVQNRLPHIAIWQVLKEMNKLQLKEDLLYRCFATLSHGEKMKILLIILFLKPNNFLLIDEPTNHLDMASRQSVSAYLNTKRGFIVISHDRSFLDSCIDHVMVINNTSIEVQKGNYHSWKQNKQQEDEFALAQNNKLQKEIKRLKKTAAQKAQWSDRVEATKIGNGPCDRGYIGHKAAKMMKRSKAIEKRVERQIEAKQGLLKDIDDVANLKLHELAFNQERLLYLQNVSIYIENNLVHEDISFSLYKHERISIQGKNGAGKSSLLKLLIGDKMISYRGKLHIANNLIISYVCQDIDQLQGTLTNHIYKHQIAESLFKTILRKLGFTADDFMLDLAQLSDGQKKKILLATSLATPAHLYIWDEPLNYIDIISRLQIEQLLLEFAPTLLFVEHDQSFNAKIATKIITL
ncbi:MAG: ABC-F type ribosomal protection protein [Erysipelotrichaceae bacterium]|nr:ABC-F type ribosomal protection protein [Erysipelotrichaceae bacterium]MDY5252332.1 ABC-F type ribosomal protection protein [Erysipelotrichaceae bacterium]